MVKINSLSKRGQTFLLAYENSSDTTLNDVYRTCSSDKRIAETACRKKMVEEGGEGFRIMGHNSSFFSCGWMTPDGDLRVETAYGSYRIVK